MPPITFSSGEKADLVGRLQRYFEDALQQRIGPFDAALLLDFIAAEMGAHVYHRGLCDAQTIPAQRIDDLQDAIGPLVPPQRGGGDPRPIDSAISTMAG